MKCSWSCFFYHLYKHNTTYIIALKGTEILLINKIYEIQVKYTFEYFDTCNLRHKNVLIRINISFYDILSMIQLICLIMKWLLIVVLMNKSIVPGTLCINMGMQLATVTQFIKIVNNNQRILNKEQSNILFLFHVPVW